MSFQFIFFLRLGRASAPWLGNDPYRVIYLSFLKFVDISSSSHHVSHVRRERYTPTVVSVKLGLTPNSTGSGKNPIRVFTAGRDRRDAKSRSCRCFRLKTRSVCFFGDDRCKIFRSRFRGVFDGSTSTRRDVRRFFAYGILFLTVFETRFRTLKPSTETSKPCRGQRSVGGRTKGFIRQIYSVETRGGEKPFRPSPDAPLFPPGSTNDRSENRKTFTIDQTRFGRRCDRTMFDRYHRAVFN